MKKMMICQWLGMTLLGAATGCGSTRSDRYAENQGTPRGVALVYASSNTASQSCRTCKPKNGQPAQVAQVSHQVIETEAGQEVVTAAHSVVEGSDQEPPIIQVVASEPAPASPYAGSAAQAGQQAANANQSQWAPVVEHVVPSRSAGLHGESIPTRRDVHDITASPCFAKADDYSWMQGQVEYSRLSKSWRLRYASVDEVDKFGGSVTLTGDAVLDTLKDGQYIRVKGYLPNPEARGIAPSYRVESLEGIESAK